jgi:hypothetical protein
MLWIVFVILAAEAARYWNAAPERARHPARPGNPVPAPRRPTAGVRLHPAHAANLARAAFSATPAPGTPDGSAPTPRN